MLRNFSLPTIARTSSNLLAKKTVISNQVFVKTSTSSFMSSKMNFLLFSNTQVLLAPKTTKTKVGFEENDVPSEVLKNPVWDKETGEGMFDGELGEDECMLMSESEWEFFESLQLLSEEELDLLEKDTKAAKKPKK